MKTIIAFTILNFSFLTCLPVGTVFNCFAQQPGWEIIPSGTTAELNSIHFIDPFDLYVCGEVLLNLNSADSGMTWQINQFAAPVTLNDIFVIDPNVIVTVGNSGTILRTTDGGINWTTVSSGVSDNLLSVSFVGSFGICGALSQTILFSNDAGATWNIAQSGFFGGGFWGAYMLSPQIGFVAGENSIFQPLLGRTTDSGLNWNFTAFYLNNNEGRATGVDFTDLNTGYVSASVWDGQGAISKTTDNGYNWVTTFFTNPLRSVDFPISGASLVGYVVGDQGIILKTYDAGMNWLPQQSGTTIRLNKAHFKDFDFGFAVGENGIILRTTTGGEPTTPVENENQSLLTFQLFQNYPNPFNPSTKIKFTIPNVETRHASSLQMVTLKVYDILCNEVATLVNKELAAGEYEVEFSAIGGPESSIKYPASGIYFYQLKAASFIQTKKMILLR